MISVLVNVARMVKNIFIMCNVKMADGSVIRAIITRYVLKLLVMFVQRRIVEILGKNWYKF